MTKQRTIAALLGSAAILAFYGVGAAEAQVVTNPNYTVGPYVGAAGGGSFLNDISPNGGGADQKSEYDAGYVGLGTVGWGFGNGFRAEIEGGYRRNDLRSVRNSTEPNGGALGTYSAMLNGLYDIDPGALFGVESYGFMPHVGVGVGWARPRFDNAKSYNGNTISGKSDGFAYQGIAGVSYAIMPQLKLDLDYRYFGTDRGTYNSSPGITPGVENRTRTSLGDQEVTFGVRYEFWTPQVAQAPLPAVAPPPAPVAKAPEVQRAFQVFFDFNKSDITAAAAKVIQQASDSVKAGNLTQINVTGHTDTVGSAKYNQALSERRAVAVKQQLIADGVPNNEIATSGVGKSGLLVPTADGVREPQNRRAEIVLQ
jgi:outer membrane protein OmpA-like peptidoglycan-associated protein